VEVDWEPLGYIIKPKIFQFHSQKIKQKLFRKDLFTFATKAVRFCSQVRFPTLIFGGEQF
jgi:hypothetical protein